MEENEWDLTPYVDLLIRRWWMAALTLVACVATVAVALWLRPVTYRAEVVVATVKASTQVSLGSAIRTVSETDLGTADRRQRLIAFEQLIKSPAVAEDVLGAIGDQLPATLRQVDELLKIVQGNIIKDSDALQITISHADPQVAVLVANAWGQAYVRQVNLIYAGTVGESHAAIQNEIESARANYDQAQAALEALLRQDRFDELTRRISEYEAMLQSMADARGRQVAALLEERQQIDRLLADAELMYAQVRRGSDAAAKSNALALPLLKAQALASSGQSSAPRASITQDRPIWETSHPAVSDGSPASGTSGAGNTQIVVQSGPSQADVQIQVSPVNMTGREMADDLEAFIAALEDRRSALNQELANLTEAAAQSQDWTLSTPLAPSIAQIEQRVRDLRAELTREQSRLNDTQAQRDLAWQSYDSLLRKEAEMAIAAQTTAAQVRLAAPARVPVPASVGAPKIIAIAAAVGLAVGVALIYLLEFLRGYRARAARSPQA